MTFSYHSPPDSQGRYKPPAQQPMWSIQSLPPYTPHLEVDQRFATASFQDLQPQPQSQSHQQSVPHPYQHQQRQRVSSTFWDDEHTYVYQVEVEHPTGTFTTVSRREDNSMINGTKLLNVVGLSRGKRDGILKNEKDRVVIKVGAMSLKGVWIAFDRAEALAEIHKVSHHMHPLFEQDIKSHIPPVQYQRQVNPPSMYERQAQARPQMPMSAPMSTRMPSGLVSNDFAFSTASPDINSWDTSPRAIRQVDYLSRARSDSAPAGAYSNVPYSSFLSSDVQRPSLLTDSYPQSTAGGFLGRPIIPPQSHAQYSPIPHQQQQQQQSRYGSLPFNQTYHTNPLLGGMYAPHHAYDFQSEQFSPALQTEDSLSESPEPGAPLGRNSFKSLLAAASALNTSSQQVSVGSSSPVMSPRSVTVASPVTKRKRQDINDTDIGLGISTRPRGLSDPSTLRDRRTFPSSPLSPMGPGSSVITSIQQVLPADPSPNHDIKPDEIKSEHIIEPVYEDAVQLSIEPDDSSAKGSSASNSD